MEQTAAAPVPAPALEGCREMLEDIAKMMKSSTDAAKGKVSLTILPSSVKLATLDARVMVVRKISYQGTFSLVLNQSDPDYLIHPLELALVTLEADKTTQTFPRDLGGEHLNETSFTIDPLSHETSFTIDPLSHEKCGGCCVDAALEYSPGAEVVAAEWCDGSGLVLYRTRNPVVVSSGSMNRREIKFTEGEDSDLYISDVMSYSINIYHRGELKNPVIKITGNRLCQGFQRTFPAVSDGRLNIYQVSGGVMTPGFALRNAGVMTPGFALRNAGVMSIFVEKQKVMDLAVGPQSSRMMK